MAYVGYNEARKRANEKYLAKFERIAIRIEPDFKKEIERKAQEQGKSVQAYVIEAIKKNMES